MPTENRSSNAEMVSVPAAHDLASKVREAMDRQACPNAWMLIAYEAVVKNFPAPAPQPHPEPIAWMVGTAIWWTKEEAERDAAATGLPIVGLGPLYSGQVQGEPVAWRYRHAKPGMSWFFTESPDASGCLVDGFEYEVSPLYVHTDPGDVERLRGENKQLKDLLRKLSKACKDKLAIIESQRAELAERDGLLDRVVDHANFWRDHPYAEVVEAIARDYKALSASAEPSEPVSAEAKP
ncbi:hypothetical protein [Pseudomonas putida]|uniref:hypothetical protein n=1 Tax=Pseudomonas putida TaxID=303 RepID=UPI000D349D4E|nr:hypothetical protein [Pseudomonas putida]PTV59134.1 hypothetical protein DBL03_16785 [Pseudomonas putida]